MTEALAVDAARLREEVQSKYRGVATAPRATYHFHTGRVAARRLGYDMSLADSLPDRAVESFAGVGKPVGPRRAGTGGRCRGAGSRGGLGLLCTPAPGRGNGARRGGRLTAREA